MQSQVAGELKGLKPETTRTWLRLGSNLSPTCSTWPPLGLTWLNLALSRVVLAPFWPPPEVPNPRKTLQKDVNFIGFCMLLICPSCCVWSIQLGAILVQLGPDLEPTWPNLAPTWSNLDQLDLNLVTLTCTWSQLFLFYCTLFAHSLYLFPRPPSALPWSSPFSDLSPRLSACTLSPLTRTGFGLNFNTPEV